MKEKDEHQKAEASGKDERESDKEEIIIDEQELEGDGEKTPVEAETDDAKEITKPSSDEPTPEVTKPTKPKSKNRLIHYLKTHKKVSIPLAILVVLLILFAIPTTRYSILGLVLKQTVNVDVKDAKTNTPVSDAEVLIANKSARTNGQGRAMLNDVPLGQKTIKITKKYYKDTEVKHTVGIKRGKVIDVKLEATGRQVSVLVTNKITGKVLSEATLKSGDIEAKTDKGGRAILVVPIGTTEQKVLVKLNGFVDSEAKLAVSDSEVKENKLSLTPNGKIYFLSKKSGKIDVVKTNLDGTERATVLAGTGKEEDRGTILLASRDWKYLALLSRREGDLAKLYLIETATDKLTTMDEGNANFGLVGWADDTFVYRVDRINKSLQQGQCQNKATAFKSFTASGKQLRTLDESIADGPQYNCYTQSFQSPILVKNELFYTKAVNSINFYSTAGTGTPYGLYAVKADGSGKRAVKQFTKEQSKSQYVSVSLYKPRELYLVHYNDSSVQYFEYENGKLTEDAKLKDEIEKFNNSDYPTYLESPAGKENFWSESRDGKDTLFIGNEDAGNSKELASLSEYRQYGWYTNDYLLISKKDSELYVFGRDGLKEGQSPLKITDYHKPTQTFRSYGGGYGGF